MLLTGLLSRAFLYNPGPPAEGWYHPQWEGPSLPHQSLIKKMHYRLDYSQSHGGIFSMEASSTQVTPVCVTLRKTNQHEVLLPWLFLLLSAHHCSSISTCPSLPTSSRYHLHQPRIPKRECDWLSALQSSAYTRAAFWSSGFY